MKKLLLLFLLTINCIVFSQPLIFISEKNGRADLFYVQEDGSGLKQLTNTDAYELMASVHPQGNIIVFAASNRAGEGFSKPQIFTLTLDNDEIRQLTDDDKKNFSPTFSPDGKLIAYTAMTDDYNADIWIMNTDGNNKRPLTGEKTYEANPAWGVWGRDLLYQASNSGQSGIRRMNQNGTRALTNLEPGFAFSPSWASDGSRFVYGIIESGRNGANLIIADANGNTLEELKSENEIRSHPRLSQDGTKLVFDQNKENRSGVFIYDLKTKKTREIGDPTLHNYAPAWINSQPRKKKSAGLTTPAIRFNDDAGNIIIVNPTQLPETIVSLSPALTEVIFALGTQKLLRGVTMRSTYPPAAKLIPRVGSYATPDWEKIKKINPDYVFLSTALQKKFVQQVKDIGAIPVLFNPSSIDQALKSFTKMSLILTGKPTAGRKLAASIKKQIAELETKVAAVKNQKRVYLEINGPDSLYTIAKGSFMHDLLRHARIKNVFADKENVYPKISDAEVIAANPEVIIIDHPLQFKKGLSKRPGWREIEAVKNGQVFDGQDFDTLILDRPGPRLPEALKIIINLTYPELKD